MVSVDPRSTIVFAAIGVGSRVQRDSIAFSGFVDAAVTIIVYPVKRREPGNHHAARAHTLGSLVHHPVDIVVESIVRW